MLKAAKTDLEDLCDAMEHLKAELPRLTLSECVDVAARLRAARKIAEQIDEFIKDSITKKLKHKAGEVRGEVFKANLTLIPTTRLDQRELKEENPDIYERYCHTTTQERITFEPR